MVKYKEGGRVFHMHFGLGTIIEVAAKNRVKVYFAQLGNKVLDLNYAPLRLSTSEDEPGGYTNKARVLYVHHGHESHAALQIGHVCLPAHMYQSTDLYDPSDGEEGAWNRLISVNLTIYSALVEPYEPTEDNPLFGIHKPLWQDERLIGRIRVSTGVTVRRPDSVTVTPSSPIDWHGVTLEGFGKILDLDEEGDPVVASCGVWFNADIEPWDRQVAPLEKGDLVTFKGYLVAFETP
jgi:hypothetical protein